MLSKVLVLLVGVSALTAHAQERAMENYHRLFRAQPAWRAVVATRAETASYVYFVNHGGRSNSLRQWLIQDLKFSPFVASEWSNGRGSISLAEGLQVARFLEVQAWWLLGLDVLGSEFGPHASYSQEQNLLSIEIGGVGFTRFKELIRAALNTRMPFRPEGHIYEPASACDVTISGRPKIPVSL